MPTRELTAEEVEGHKVRAWCKMLEVAHTHGEITLGSAALWMLLGRDRTPSDIVTRVDALCTRLLGPNSTAMRDVHELERKQRERSGT